MKMLKTCLSVSAIVLATASLTLAQPPGGRGPGEGPESNVDRMFNHDENKDGKLGKNEVPGQLQGIFARADKDEDGFLSKEEVQAYFRSRAEEQGNGRGEGRGGREGREGGRSREGGGRGGFGGRSESGTGPGGPRGMPPFPVMMVLDADGNGEISADEINNATAALKKLDRNRNGKLDADELRPSFGGGPPGGGFGGGPPGGGREGGGHGGFGGQSFVGGMLERYDEDKDGKLAGDEIPERMQDRLEQIDANKDKTIDKAELEAMARQFGGGRGGEGGRGDGDQRRRPPIEEE
jgi:Ca2+-binding EF-hand superfamily protein